MPRHPLALVCGGVLAGALAATVAAGPIRLWAPEDASKPAADPHALTAPTGLDVDGCHLTFTVREEKGSTRLVVHGANPGTAERSLVVVGEVKAFPDTEAESMSRMGPMPRERLRRECTLTIAAAGTAEAEIDLGTVAADEVIAAESGKAGFIVRWATEPHKVTRRTAAKPGTAVAALGEDALIRQVGKVGTEAKKPDAAAP